MGFLKIFQGQTKAPAPLPTGSFTIDSTGEILTSTVPSSFSRDSLKTIGHNVIEFFREAKRAEQSFTELTVQYSALDLKARELRGGAIIFLSPRTKNGR
jgi:hypothetical protein